MGRDRVLRRLSSISRRQKLVWPAAFTIAVCAISLGLGFWQLKRRETKHDLIAAIAARSTAPPEPLADVGQWPHLRPADYEYRHVTIEGRFLPGKTILLFRPSGPGPAVLKEPGYDVLTPLHIASGAYVIVDRGFVPQTLIDSIALGERESSDPIRITGLMRAPETRSLFTPADDLARGRAFARDPEAIATFFGLEPAAAFSIDAEASGEPHLWPRAGSTELRLPDNHLAYALTWFGLAATGAAVFCAYVRGQRQEPA
jgi:surfeit locus 1 family protein